MNFTSFVEHQPYLLVFEPGDEIIATLRELARERGIRAATFLAIGAIRAGEIAWWNPDTRSYERIGVTEQMEIGSLFGDIAIEGDEVRIHSHVVLGRRDGSALAGHLLSGTVFPTLEMQLTAFDGTITRTRDSATGLALISIGAGK